MVPISSTSTIVFAAGQRTTAYLRLNGRGNGLLAIHHKLPATLTFTQPGLNGTTLISTQIITFKTSRKQ